MRRVIGAVLVLALVVGAIGVGLWWVTHPQEDAGPPPIDPGRSAPTPRETPAMPAAPAGLEDFYSQKLDWQPCEDNVDHECARLRVPVDYDDPSGDTIELNLLRVPAADPEGRIGSLVVNPGGPGAPGTSYAAAADRAFGSAVRAFYDIVGFDPRGTGDSSPVDCLSDDRLDDYLAMDGDPDTAAERAEYTQLTRDFADGCAESGAIADHVSTVEAARDMDVLRAALGEPRLDYFGASYGTKLGSTYAKLFAANTGRLVLDGAVDTTLSTRQSSLQQARGFETALRAYVADCVKAGDCYLGDSVDEGIGTIQQFLDDVDAAPLDTDADRDLTVGLAVYGIITPLYNRDYWLLLTQALDAGLDGDGTALLALADAYASRGPSGFLDNSIEANLDINCLDDPSSIPMGRVPAQLPAFEKASPTLGAIFAYGLTACSGFDRAGVPLPTDHAEKAAPLLVIGTTRDPATPLRWAEAMSRDLATSVLIRRDGDGHTGYNAGNTCVDDAVESFLLDGTVPSATLDC